MLIQKYIEQMQKGMYLMREACQNIPFSECPTCPFYPDCNQNPENMPLYWENSIST